MVEFEDALLEIGKDNLNLQNTRFKDSDTKAISIITICGILTTLLINFGKVEGLVSKILFSLTALSLLGTVILSVYVIRPRRVEVLSTQFLIDFFKDKSQGAQVTGIIATIANAEKELRIINELKAIEIIKSVYALGISVFLMILYAFSIFL